MAKKVKSVYVCQECGYETPRWLGQCICGAWNSFVEEKVVDIKEDDARRRSGISGANGSKSKAAKLNIIGSAEYMRIDTGIGELNRVLGGGIVKGSLTLISGEPGIGKSTIIIQAANHIAKTVGRVLYVSGEESEEQIKMRADRVCGEIDDRLFILAETNMENIMAVCETLEPEFVIIDSIQTMYTADIDSAPGSVSQVRSCGNLLMKIGKSWNIPVFIVAHVTKNGELAGPKIVEHLVDCVLHFMGERNHELRIMRAFKNRFGTTSEIGAFSMEESGLKEIHDISASFLDSRGIKPEGSVVSAIYEGSRPVFMEIQALTVASNVGFARRTSIGIDNQRLAMLLAVLERKAGINTISQDVYVNVVGGLKADSTSVDLGVVLAVYSSGRNIRCGYRLIAFGEIGLTGELRSVSSADKIIAEAVRMGYEKVIMPKKNATKLGEKFKNCKIIGVNNIYEAIEAFKEQ